MMSVISLIRMGFQYGNTALRKQIIVLPTMYAPSIVLIIDDSMLLHLLLTNLPIHIYKSQHAPNILGRAFRGPRDFGVNTYLTSREFRGFTCIAEYVCIACFCMRYMRKPKLPFCFLFCECTTILYVLCIQAAPLRTSVGQ
jgi:hypothetical protein